MVGKGRSGDRSCDDREEMMALINLSVFLNHVNVAPIQKFFWKNYIHHYLKQSVQFSKYLAFITDFQ